MKFPVNFTNKPLFPLNFKPDLSPYPLVLYNPKLKLIEVRPVILLSTLTLKPVLVVDN